MPPGAGRLWDWFLDLHAHRRRTDWGDPVPLDAAALLAWGALLGVPLAPRDAGLLLALDRLWRRVDAEAAASRRPAAAPRPQPPTPPPHGAAAARVPTDAEF